MLREESMAAHSYEGHIETMQLLIEHGADVNASGGNYGNALQAASYSGDMGTVQFLIGHGANVNAQGRSVWQCIAGSIMLGIY
jgi:ankyrin repeat protein